MAKKDIALEDRHQVTTNSPTQVVVRGDEARWKVLAAIRASELEDGIALCIGKSLDRVCNRCEGTREEHVVVVEHQDPWVPGGGNPSVPRGTDAEVRFLSQHGHQVGQIREDIGYRLSRSVVDDEDFHIRPLLGDNRLDRAANEVRTVIGWEDDREREWLHDFEGPPAGRRKSGRPTVHRQPQPLAKATPNP
jgi:hypothetical protein